MLPPKQSAPVPAEYHGFSGTWDSKARVFVFASCEERDRWQIRTYGHVRNGFRTEDEPIDERPLLIYPNPQFKDHPEQATYEAAVSLNPKREDEGPLAYAKRISEIVTQEREAGAKAMPHVRPSRRQTDERLAELREQEKGL